MGMWSWVEAVLNLLTRSGLESPATESESLVGESKKEHALLQEYVWSDFQTEYGSHLDLILNICPSPIANQYGDGKLKFEK